MLDLVRLPTGKRQDAAWGGRVRVVKMLLERGLPVLAVDKCGRTPLEVARTSGHGDDAIPLLTRATKAAIKASGGKAVAVEGADLTREAMVDAVKALPAKEVTPAARRALERQMRAAFTGKAAIKIDDFLRTLADQDDVQLLAAGMLAASTATTRKPTNGKHATGDVDLVHVGDLTIGGDCDAIHLVVTGNLTVEGRLTNWEGRVVCVGGTLTAETIVTEGPMWVGGDLHAERGMLATYNDYATLVRGELITPVLIQDQHVVEAKVVSAAKHYRERSAIPPAERITLGKLLRVKLDT